MQTHKGPANNKVTAEWKKTEVIIVQCNIDTRGPFHQNL